MGTIATGAMLGSALLTLLVGLWAHRLSRRVLLLFAAATMFLTGLGSALFENFWLLLTIAFLGTLNPSSLRKLGIKEGTRIQIDVDENAHHIILIPTTREYIQSLRGKYKGRGLLEALAAEKEREREL